MNDQANAQQGPFVFEEDARSWFHRLRGGGTVLDAHLAAIHEVFGQDIPLRFRAALDARTGRPRVLLIEVLRGVDDGEANENLVRVQERLLAREEDLRSRSARRQPFGNIVVSLGLPPEQWTSIVESLEGES